jgi:diguanylate cyclase (GGDEF)-like protein
VEPPDVIADLDILCLIIVAILGFGAKDRSERPFLRYRLFMAMLAGTGCMLLLDAALRTLEGIRGAGPDIVVAAASHLYYLGLPLPSALYALYVEYHAKEDERALRSRVLALSAPFAATTILALSNPLTGLYFSIDASNHVVPGPFHLIFLLVPCLYLIYSTISALVNRKRIDSRNFPSLLLFPVAPLLGGFAESLVPGAALALIGNTLSLLVVYTNIQNRRLTSDYLTGVRSRRLLDEFVERKAASSKDRKGFSGILLDIDGFKLINDRFGHAEGDRALVEFVRILRSCLRRDDFVARYAGDEFVVVLGEGDEDFLAQVVARIRAGFSATTATSTRSYSLSPSIGAAVFDPHIDEGGDAFIDRLDGLMYMDKESRRRGAGETRPRPLALPGNW